MRTTHSSIAAIAVALVITVPARAQSTQRVSLSTAGVPPDKDSFYSAITPDGRYVAFSSRATNLVPADTNDSLDVFVRDRRTGVTERVSMSTSGEQGDFHSAEVAISADGRYVAFNSGATNLVADDTNGFQDIFVRDRLAGTTVRVSVSSSGREGHGALYGAPSISADGRYVAFASHAGDLVPGDTNGFDDVFVHDRESGMTERVSVSELGVQPNLWCDAPSISADGRWVAFSGWASNLVAGDTNGNPDVFVRDLRRGRTERLSVGPGGVQADGMSIESSISGDGNRVSFTSDANIFFPPNTFHRRQVVVRDRARDTVEVASVSSTGGLGDNESERSRISADGLHVAFVTRATNLVEDDGNAYVDVFVRDLATGTTERVSVDSAGTEVDRGGTEPAISADGLRVVFVSAATNIIQGETDGIADTFVRDRVGGTSFASLCDPGAGGVAPCPCSNVPSGPGRGCDSSAGTGGAVLAASGASFLSSDSLVLRTTGQRAEELSLLLQGTASIASGRAYGQGVRCVGGSIRRLYTVSAESSSVLVPDFAAGDVPISKRSSAMGDEIRSGERRWYQVVYRDPVVLGGCPATSTFNATQAGVVTWSP